jgi:hypothetical protein
VIKHIDVSVVLRGTVCDLYSNLVTRSTGAAVRAGIEEQLAEVGGRTLTVIDFSHVGLLDYSCADEIVAKLLIRHCRGVNGAAATDAAADGTAPERFFLFRGISEGHHDAIEAVLQHHGLALVAEAPEGPLLLGAVDDGEREAWNVVCRLGAAAPPEVAVEAGLESAEAEQRLESLRRRRLVMRIEDVYVPLGAT